MKPSLMIALLRIVVVLRAGPLEERRGLDRGEDYGWRERACQASRPGLLPTCRNRSN
jgi:hypothetical protein